MSEPKAHLSYSSVTNYFECPYRWKLTKLLGLRENPAVWLIGGSAFHEATELFDEGYDHGIFAVDDIHRRFDTAFDKYSAAAELIEPDPTRWKAAKKGKEDAEWWRGFGRDLIDKYIAFRTTSHYSVAYLPDRVDEGMTELAVEIDIPHYVGGVLVKAFVDRVMVDTNTGELVILDLKTGARMPDNDKQLGVYKVGLEAHFGPGFNTGVFYDARKGRTTEPASLDHHTPESVGLWFATARARIDSGDFAPLPNRFCQSCDFRDSCPSYSPETYAEALEAELASLPTAA